MSPWVVFAVLTAVAVGLIAVPLLRRQAQQRDSAEFDTEVYRDQLEEAERDTERGVLSADEADAAKAEIARRLLRAADDAGTKSVRASGAGRWVPVAAVAVAIPVIALGGYALVGNPDLRDEPFTSRADVRTDQTADTTQPPHSMEEAVTQLARRMEQNPDRLDGWLLLGRSYMSLKRYDDAAKAYGRAVSLAGDRSDIASARGEALVAAKGGSVSEEAARSFASALERNPFDPKSLYYLGLRDAQQGDMKGAIRSWADLITISPDDAPWLPTVRDNIVRATKEAGIDPDSVAAMSSVKSPEQKARIRKMSDRLAARLNDNPDDEVGWRALALSYRVLGDETKAKKAEGTAEALAEATRQAQERKLALTGGPVPTKDQPRVRTMVRTLAARLAAEPNDIEGWRMLARSYRVLGEQDKAADAQAKAEALARGEKLAATPPPAPAPAAAPPGGKRLQGVTPADEARIRTMVKRLADRLANDPDDEQGWRMLARSYGVLGDAEKAQDAQAKADQLAAKRGTEAQQPPSGPAEAAPPGGTRLQGVSPADETRIRTMVKRLADRLAANPDDEQGWRMLARSYGVLGEADKAKDAQAKADELAAKQSTGAQQPPSPPASAAPAPSQGLKGFAPSDQARIRTMVKRLADRLAANPDDEQGWRMLARSYGVLGETEKAKDAQAKADALAKQKAQ